jgi:hypothetical protein
LDSNTFLRCRFAGCLAALLLAFACHAEVIPADSLRAKYAELHDRLGNNQFRMPLYLESSESPDSVTGDMYALVDQPFATATAALHSPGDWCEILILHINTKYCRAADQGSVLNVSIGNKHDQPLDQAYRVVFAYRVAARTADYLQVRLTSHSRRFRRATAGRSSIFPMPTASGWRDAWR